MSGAGECLEKYIKYYPATQHLSEPLEYSMGSAMMPHRQGQSAPEAVSTGLPPTHEKE